MASGNCLILRPNIPCRLALWKSVVCILQQCIIFTVWIHVHFSAKKLHSRNRVIAWTLSITDNSYKILLFLFYVGIDIMIYYMFCCLCLLDLDANAFQTSQGKKVLVVLPPFYFFLTLKYITGFLSYTFHCLLWWTLSLCLALKIEGQGVAKWKWRQVWTSR